LLRDFWLAGPLAGWVPLAPRGVAGAAPGARLQTQTDKCSASPSKRFTLWGLGKTRPGPHNLLPVRIFFCSCYAWGAAPGGGGGCRGCGGRRSIELYTGMRMYVTASSTHIPTYVCTYAGRRVIDLALRRLVRLTTATAAAVTVTCNLQT
jgi:hypothetical protein